MASIIDQNGNLIIDGSGYIVIDGTRARTTIGFTPVTIPSVNVLNQMISRTLLQFRNSPVFQAVIAALASEIQALEDAIQGVMQSFVPANAVGVQEDAIGRIVGQTRGVIVAPDWFTPDSEFFAQPDNINPVWEYGAPLSGNVIADDTTYRNMIFLKVVRNFVRVASVTDIQQFVMDLFGIPCSVIITGMEVVIKVPVGTSPSIVAFLGKVVSNQQVDYLTSLPLPPGVQLAEVVEI